MEQEQKGQGVTEGQLVLEYMLENPEYVMKRVDRAIDQLVEERMEELREDFKQRFDSAINEVILRITTDQFAEIVLLPDEYVGEKSLKTTMRDLMIRKTGEYLRQFFLDLKATQLKLLDIERRLNEDDGDWWKRGGDPPASYE